MSYTNLFSPITINGMTLKNRVMMTPMGTNLANPDGSLSPEHKNYYALRARGGTGLIMVENVDIDYPLGSNGTTQLRLDHDRFIPHFYELTEEAHSWGARIGVQLNFAGASAKPERISATPVSAGNLPSKAGGSIPRPLNKEEIIAITKKFGDAAVRAKIAGFDCVELHGGHSYLLNQFLSPTMNNREDEFGGTIENRSRFLCMVAKEIRERVGPRFPVILRISAEEFVPGGLTLADTLKWLPFVNEFIDAYDVSSGLNDSLEHQIDAPWHEDGWRSYMPAKVRKVTGKPCISTGNYRDPQAAEAVLTERFADMIGIGRGLIADPDWCRKAESGHEADIRKCISCCIGCAGHRIGQNRPIRCTVNPAVTSGDTYKRCHVNKPCRVVVIGGGTAGLEAACTAAEVGCSVVLLEKNAHLGGRAAYIGQLPEKKRLLDFPAYLTHRAEGLSNLIIRTGAEATVEEISSCHPDLIVCATGSLPSTPPVPGLCDMLDKGKIQTVDGMIATAVRGDYPEDMTGKKAVIIGGGAVGLDVVEYFARRGASVTIVEMQDAIGRDLDPVTKCAMNNLIREKGVTQLVNTRLIAVEADGFITGAGKIPYDYGFVCLGMKPFDPFSQDVRMQEIAPVYVIGDSLQAPRRIIDGTAEGRNILKKLYLLGFFNE